MQSYLARFFLPKNDIFGRGDGEIKKPVVTTGECENNRVTLIESAHKMIAN